MTEAQVNQLLLRTGATFVREQGGVRWWKLPNGSWYGVRQVRPGHFEVRSFAANACGC